jgi:sugar phosphate permease
MGIPDSSVVGKSSAKKEESAYLKVTWRLMPFLFVGYIFCFLDRVNVGFAKLQMQQQLGFSETVYGLAAGIFSSAILFSRFPATSSSKRLGQESG